MKVRKFKLIQKNIEYFLLLPCPMIKVNEKLQQLNPGWTTSHPDPSEMKVWVTPPGTEL